MSDTLFIEMLLEGLGPHLPPGTPRTVDAIVAAVADMALRLDAHEDASTPAFDEIAALCGCPNWEYPAQVVRDVMGVVKERDELRERLRVAVVVRDDARAASTRDVEHRRRSAGILTVAEAFVRAHCALDQLAHDIGAEAACESPLNEQVIALHLELERVVLGNEAVPGRRSPVVPPPLNVACPVCDAKVGENCVFYGFGTVMGGGGMVHQARANRIGADLRPVGADGVTPGCTCKPGVAGHLGCEIHR